MGSLLMPLLSSVAAKAGDALLAEVMSMSGMDADRRKLERHLLAVQAVLLDAEVKSQTRPDIQEWMKELKAAANEADDVLDDFQYEALRRKAQIGESISRKVLSYFTLHSPVLFRFAMTKKLKDVSEKIDKLIKEMNQFHLLEHIETTSSVYPQTHSLVDELEIVGKEEEKEQVVKTLLSQHDNKSVTVLPIIGMGGIGKTTLAKLVYNDRRVTHHYEMPIWVCVSVKFVVVDVVRSIIETATGKKCNLPENNLEILQNELKTLLGQKRYLLILDDVWNEDEHKWDELKLLLCSNSGTGSAIIVTSRSDQVAKIMGTVPLYRIQHLDEDKSLDLFKRKAFGNGVEEQPELVEIAKSMLEKCRGLPLVIKTMAGLMSSKHSTSEWFSILNSDVWDHEVLTKGIVPALKLSYDHLSPELKRCFSFCAIFPPDTLMEKNMLIQLWIANDFIILDGALSPESKGGQIFDELVWRSFLQDVKLQERGFYWYFLESFCFRRVTCKMHDCMHDLAVSIRENGCLILQGSTHSSSSHSNPLLCDVQHLTIDTTETSTVMKEILAPRTLLFGEDTKITRGTAKSKFKSLRALRINFRLIKREIIHLKHLRYLDLSHSDMVVMPEETSMLYNLQTLKLMDCWYLEQLPEGMRHMSRLRHVYLFGCRSLKRMPAGIGQLKCLQTLTHYVVDSEAGRAIDELKDLKLVGPLYLCNLSKVRSVENAKEANLASKHNLNPLSLDWDSVGHIVDIDIAEGVLEALHPPNSIEVLMVNNYDGVKLSSWMQDSTVLKYLTKLRLSNCKHCKDLPPVWQLASLKYLYLESAHSLTSICTSVDTGSGESFISLKTFPKLERMEISYMDKLERWHQEMAGEESLLSFPQLKELRISHCPLLASMPKLPSLEDLRMSGRTRVPLGLLTNLSTLSNLEYDGLSSMGTVGLPVVSFKLWDSLVRLKFEGLSENVEPSEEEPNISPCKSIRTLEIRSCECFFLPDTSKISRSIWKYFLFVQRLEILFCDNLVLWPTAELRNLNCLRVLKFWFCKNFTGSWPSTSLDEGVNQPQLEILHIASCENLVDIPRLPSSLEILSIDSCKKLVTLPSHLGNLANLRELCLDNCNVLERLPDGMDGLTSLRELVINLCPEIEKLPEGLLRLSTLRKLHILNCDKLEKRCIRGGEYWDLIQAIPDLSVVNYDKKGSRTRFPCLPIYKR